jgi:hypothetical protein
MSSSKAIVRAYTKRKRGLRQTLPIRAKTKKEKEIPVFVSMRINCDEKHVDCWTVLGCYRTKHQALIKCLKSMVAQFDNSDAFYEMFNPTAEDIKSRDEQEREMNEVWRAKIQKLRKGNAWKAFETYAQDASELPPLEDTAENNADLEEIMKEMSELSDTLYWEVVEDEKLR